jgi:hypothetical protein
LFQKIGRGNLAETVGSVAITEKTIPFPSIYFAPLFFSLTPRLPSFYLMAGSTNNLHSQGHCRSKRQATLQAVVLTKGFAINPFQLFGAVVHQCEHDACHASFAGGDP